jgi:hypothetical protein
MARALNGRPRYSTRGASKGLTEVARQSGSGTLRQLEFWRWNLLGLLSGRWISDFRRSSYRDHFPVGFHPVGTLRAFLAPVCERGFIAPIEQFRQRAAVRAGHHEGAHGTFIVPGRQGPIRRIVVAKELGSKISSRALGLPAAAQREPHELRKVSD